MPLIRWTGKALEWTGKLVQTETFEKWAQDRGAAILENISIQTGGYIFGLGRKARAKRAVWADLEKTLKTSEPLLTSVRNTIEKYPSLLSILSDKHQALPRYDGFSKLFVVPRFLLKRHSLQMIIGSLGQSEELKKLRGGEILRQFFYEELAGNMDSEFSEASAKATPKRPLIIPRKWVVGFDPHYEWSESSDPGHYYVYQDFWTEQAGVSESAVSEATEQLAKCKDWLGRISGTTRNQLVANLPMKL